MHPKSSEIAVAQWRKTFQRD